MARIVLENISMVYGNGTIALDGLNLAVEDGEFVVVMGPSGSGKSTLLRLIAGLEKPTDGILEFDGKDVVDLPPENRDVALVFQNYALYPHLSVFENIAFGLRLRKQSIPEIEACVVHMAERLQLADILKRSPKELSGGQRQRVAVARALVRRPRIFLFDEPLSNLNAELRIELRNAIRDRHDETGATMVFVTHDVGEASSLGDRSISLSAGKVVGDHALAASEASLSSVA